jgi:hypothetical protein
MARAMEMKTKSETALEAKIAALKAEIAAKEAALVAKEGPEWADFQPSNKRAGVVKRAKVAWHHQSNERLAPAAIQTLLSVPPELAVWVNSIAKPGERIRLQVSW